jgi:site-specific recombinase XerD
MAESDCNPAAGLRRILEAQAAEFRRGLLSTNTQRGYRYDWAVFERWCRRMDLDALPASVETLSLYATDQMASGRKVSTAARRVAAVARAHRCRDFASPVTFEVRELFRGARRLRIEQPRQVRALSVADLRAISIELARDPTMRGIRDRAILVTGFASALRSASLVALTLEDVEFVPEGIRIRVRREKQDQEGKGRWVGLPSGRHGETCPVRCLRAWLDRRGAAPGPLFTRLDGHAGAAAIALQPERICQIVQAAVARIGLDPRLYGSHSLRAGFITEAGEHGVGELLIASQTGHRDMSTLRRYFRRRDLFRSNACAALGL